MSGLIEREAVKAIEITYIAEGMLAAMRDETDETKRLAKAARFVYTAHVRPAQDELDEAKGELDELRSYIALGPRP